MSEFERTKRTVSGRSIVITTWFNEGQKTWQASAPAYSYLSAVSTLSQEGCSTREAAIKRLSNLLANYFESTAR